MASRRCSRSARVWQAAAARLVLRVALFCSVAANAPAGVREERERYARLRFAAGTFEARHPLADVAAQTWRRFVPAWLVTTAVNVSNATLLPEPRWPHSSHDTWWAVPSQVLGDQRNGVAILLGNATGQAYDWVLYGDDDTLYLMDNALEMLRGLDAATPYFLSDALSMDRCVDVHKNSDQFCALPGTAESTGTRWEDRTCVMHPATAPCLRELFEANGTSCATQRSKVWGGAGYVFSRGMVHNITSELWHSFEVQHGESDSLATQMVWAAGFAPTNPSWVPHSAVHNDSLPNARTVVDGTPLCRFGRDGGFHDVWNAARSVIAGEPCSGHCQVRSAAACSMHTSAPSDVPLWSTQHLLFNRVGIHLGAGKAHTDPAQLRALVEDVRQMYADYEVAKAVLRTLAKLGNASRPS